MSVMVQIDHKLRIALSELPPAVADYIAEALSIPNVARQKAMEQNVWGWQAMPETIPLWDIINDRLVMPRGFFSNLTDGLTASDVEFEIDDRRVFRKLPPIATSYFELRAWQEPAVETIIEREQGIWKAPAGSGKTVGVLETISRLNCRSIVLVNSKDILWQWIDRVKAFLGDHYPVSQIGDGQFEISQYLTIATVQTLHSRYDDLEFDGFFDRFSFVCLDECHHATAETYNRIVNRFSSRYRIGVSATPDKTGDFALATNVLGPIIHRTKKEDVDALVNPQIFRIATDFSFAYRGARGRRPSNYPKLIQSLVEDSRRNSIIAKSIFIESGSHSLVISKRLEHLDILMSEVEKLGYPHAMLRLTANESSEMRQKIVEYASREPCVIFSTLADEALDIPRLDRLFLVFPQRNPGLIEQQVGRIARVHPGKADAKVFDFHDHRVGPLDNQWRVRRLQVYQPHGYEIFSVRVQDIMEYDDNREEICR